MKTVIGFSQSLILCAFLGSMSLHAQTEKDAMDLPGQGEQIGTPVTSTDVEAVKNERYLNLLPLALQSVPMNTSPLPEYDYNRLDYALSEGIEVTPDGRLWVCWVAGGDNDKAFVVLASSDDRGKTWSKPRAVMDPRQPGTALGRRSLVAVLWSDPKGRLWLFYDQSSGYFDGRAGVWATVCENPDAEKPDWSEPRRLWHGAALNKPIVTKNGEWLLPVSLWPRELIARPYKDLFSELDDVRRANVLASKDEGRTWELRGGVLFNGPGRTVDEPMLLERRDGTLWLTGRSKQGMWESVSSDGGREWSEAKFSAIRHCNSRHFIGRLRSGRTLLLKHGEQIDHPSQKARTRLSAFLSDDDGKTWSNGLLLVEGSGSYPDCAQAKDGTIFVCYDHSRWFDGEIRMARFTEEDILAGRFVNPESSVDITVCKAEGLTDGERQRRKEAFEAKRQKKRN